MTAVTVFCFLAGIFVVTAMSAKVFSFIFFHWCIKIHRLVVQPGLNVVSCSFFTFLWCSSGNPHQLWLWLENRKTHNTAVFLQRCHCKWVDNVGEGINDLFHIACKMLTVASSGAVAAEKQRAAEPAEIIGRRHRRNFYGAP